MTYNQPDEQGKFGQFGGRYVSESLMPLILELEKFYKQADVLLNSDLRSAREVAQQVIVQFRLATGARK